MIRRELTSTDSMARKATIFDVDGTLIDSVDLHAQAWREAFAEVGKQLHFLEIRSQIGKGSDMLLPCFLNKEEIARFGHTVSKRQQEIFKEQYGGRVRPFSSIPELFTWLRKEGWIVVLASSGKRDEVRRHKKMLQIEKLTDLVICSDDAEKSKPHADMFEVVLKKLKGIVPQRVLAIGDTPYDVEAAAKVNIRTIGLLGGGFPADELIEAGAVAIFRGPSELLFRYSEWSSLVQ
jgi:phosphoglycolate phosphatase-like HAD superfamily hydrolase